MRPPTAVTPQAAFSLSPPKATPGIAIGEQTALQASKPLASMILPEPKMSHQRNGEALRNVHFLHGRCLRPQGRPRRRDRRPRPRRGFEGMAADGAFQLGEESAPHSGQVFGLSSRRTFAFQVAMRDQGAPEIQHDAVFSDYAG